MLNLDYNSNPETLAEAHELIRELKQLNDNAVNEQKAIVDHYSAKLKTLQNMFRRVLNSVYGTSSEISKSLFDEAELIVVASNADKQIDSIDAEPSDPSKSSSTKQRKKRKVLPDHLPREDIIHDLTDEEKTCKNDGSTLVKIGEDIREELAITPARMKVVRHITLKYACSKCHAGVRCACGPKRLIPGSVASPSILATLITSKYLDHLPLYRQEQMFKRNGVEITRATMASWVIKSAEALQPLINLIKDDILSDNFIQCDETPLLVLKSEGVQLSKKKYMWVMGRRGPPGGRPAVIYELGPGRGGDVAERLLGDYSGFVQTDALKSYDRLAASKNGRRVGCMAHVRRNFVNVLKSISKDKRANHPAAQVVKLIAELYQIESDIRENFASHPDLNFNTFRATNRLDRATSIFLKIEDFISTELLEASTQSPYGKALSYAQDELPKIKLYLTNGDTELDNNWIENMIRPFALGRKNWLFADTEKGAEASANIYSLVQTAKSNGINVAQYLEEVFVRIPYCENLEDFEDLLPWNFKW